MLRTTSAREASRYKYPEWIVLIVTISPGGQVNVMPAGWSMYTSFEPPMYAVSVGHQRYTHELIESTGEFTVAFPGPEMGPAVEYCGTHSGREEDKMRATGLLTRLAAQIRPPLLVGAGVNLECRVTSRLDTGDHTIFAGTVLAAHVAEHAVGRLLNFGQGLYALARPQPGSKFQAET